MDSEVVASWLVGGFLVAFALLILVVLLGKDDPGFRFVVPGFFASLGSALIVGSTAALPGWAERRQHQMEELALRVTALFDSGGHDAQSDHSQA
jgi:hypothetical protein